MKNENRIEKSAIFKGVTKYHDKDTGEFLEAFEEGRNLELVSVQNPSLTTSNEDGTKSNTLTVNEDVTLRGIGDVQDTLDCLTGEVTERIGEIMLDGSEDWVIQTNPTDVRYAIYRLSISDIPTSISNAKTNCMKLGVRI